MPRPRPLKQRPADARSPLPQQFDKDDLSAITEALGINRDPKKGEVSVMAKHLALILENHRLAQEAHKRTPARIVQTLRPRLALASKLRDSIFELDADLRRELYPARLQAKRFTPEIALPDQYFSDIVEAIRDAIDRYKEYVSRGVHRDLPLVRTVQALSHYFDFHNRRKGDRVEEWRRNFIHRALEAGHVKHPDPDEQRSRFDGLLQTSSTRTTKKSRRLLELEAKLRGIKI